MSHFALSVMSAVLKFFFRLSLILLATFVAGSILLFDLSAKTPPPAEPSVDDFIRVSSSLKKHLAEIKQRPSTLSIQMSSDDIVSFSRLLKQHVPQLNVNLEPSNNKASVALSYRLFSLFWLNAETTISAGEEISIEALRIGRFRFSSKNATWLINNAAKHLSNTTLATINAHIRSASFSEDIVQIETSLPSSVQQKTKHLFNALSFLSADEPVMTPKYNYYQQRVLAYSKNERAIQSRHNVAVYLQYLSTRVEGQPMHTINDHQNAILALASFTKSDVLVHILPAPAGLNTPHIDFTIKGRRDLASHFLVSAAFSLLSEVGKNEDIGHAKEILDSQGGGSGFSFKDIAADRAGIRFAQYLKQQPDEFPLLQIDNESDFFPDVDDLQEGMSLNDFNLRYGDSNSVAYQSVITEIDNRIAQRPLFQ